MFNSSSVGFMFLKNKKYDRDHYCIGLYERFSNFRCTNFLQILRNCSCDLFYSFFIPTCALSLYRHTSDVHSSIYNIYNKKRCAKYLGCQFATEKLCEQQFCFFYSPWALFYEMKSFICSQILFVFSLLKISPFKFYCSEKNVK